MIAVICDPELLTYLASDEFPEEPRNEILDAIASLSQEKVVALATSLADYGAGKNVYRYEAGAYRLLFEYPHPPEQEGGYQLLWLFDLIEPTQRIEQKDFLRDIVSSTWQRLKSTAFHK